jgi:NAD(P)-dependent dehydrogenase (short-subunit alcohol dehydrogenase family)
LNNKICIVTGGANGIGRCITGHLIEAGAFVALIDMDADAGSMLQSRYGKDRLSFFHGDVADKSVLDRFLDEFLSCRDRVDVLVNNACLMGGGLRSASYEDFDYILRVGATAPFYLTKRLAPHFSPCACVVNISSTRDRMSQPDTESYAAAKGAISALTHAMSVTLAGKARVNSISPGWIDTGAYQHNEEYTPSYSMGDILQHPAGRVGRPEDIAEAVLFLCSDKAGFITGENITIDGGMTRLMVYSGDHGWNYDGWK